MSDLSLESYEVPCQMGPFTAVLFSVYMLEAWLFNIDILKSLNKNIAKLK